MEQPMFYQGQRVVYVGLPKSARVNPENPVTVEGKSYYVSNPAAEVSSKGTLYITLREFSEDVGFMQRAFIPHDTDQALENEIHQALKEDLKVKNFQDN